MESCFQFKELNTLEHGKKVFSCYRLLMGTENWNDLAWPVPDWMVENKEFLKSNQVSFKIIRKYLIYHDCGKWFCHQKDSSGASHFRDHAQISAWIWESLFGPGLVPDLMARDMDLHLLKPSELKNYAHKKLIPTLLISAYCELIANSEMFGGFESISFKIKYKNLKRIANNYFRERLYA